MDAAERKLKIELLARALSGYDEETWKRLRENRRETYRRAANALALEPDRFKKLIDELR